MTKFTDRDLAIEVLSNSSDGEIRSCGVRRKDEDGYQIAYITHSSPIYVYASDEIPADATPEQFGKIVKQMIQRCRDHHKWLLEAKDAKRSQPCQPSTSDA